MLRRKIEKQIYDFLRVPQERIMIVQGARQVGKSFIIREIGKKLFPNFIEINLAEDKNNERLYENVKSVDELYFRISITYGDKLIGDKNDTLIFLDEIQEYPQLITLLKFLNSDGRYRFICSGSLLGITLHNVVSIPVGSIRLLDMYPLDFQEFLWANGFNDYAIDTIQETLSSGKALDEAIHNHLLELWKKYLVVGGMPRAVVTFKETNNYQLVREIQYDINRLYEADAAKYDLEHKLKIIRLYRLIPSNMENKKKRISLIRIEDRKGSRFKDYEDEFEFLISSGIALEVKAVSNPKFPLVETETKNLLKLYLNDPGLLTSMLYRDEIRAVLDDFRSINLGSVYETAVAAQLKANGSELYYYDNKKKGEVDFLINYYKELSVLPIEVKSGKDYKIHSAISKFTADPEYHITKGIVLSNSRDITKEGDIWYYPIYYCAFL